jgi:hypothetical protein
MDVESWDGWIGGEDGRLLCCPDKSRPMLRGLHNPAAPHFQITCLVSESSTTFGWTNMKLHVTSDAESTLQL